MCKKSILLFLSLSLVINHSYSKKYDLTVVGMTRFADGLGRLALTFVDCLKDEIKVNFKNVNPRDLLSVDIPLRVKKIITTPQTEVGNVALSTCQIWNRWSCCYDYMPDSPIKIAYSMIESSAIPFKWVERLNKLFDAVVVPDEYYLEVYKNSGVKIPIFIIPCPLYLDDFLKSPVKEKLQKPFRFGVSANFFPAKNLLLLVDAFNAIFKNTKDVELWIHGRYAQREISQKIKSKIKNYNLNNIKTAETFLSQAHYKSFFECLDCYVLLSKGEGFSITPREALAMGIPCIISDNTAHHTICKTGLVRAVNSQQVEPAYYYGLNCFSGYNYNSLLSDVCLAILDVYKNYPLYKSKALQGREWVKQYNYKELKKIYLSLVKPKKIILGKYNKITEHELITNSVSLYNKYLSIL